MKLNLRKKLYAYELFYIAVFSIAILFVVLVPIDFWLRKNFIDINYVNPILSVYVAIIIFYVFYRLILNVIITKHLEDRKQKLALNAFANKMDSGSILLSDTLLSISKADAKQTNYYVTKDWGYCDYEFSVYRKSKYGRHKAKTFYFAVGVFDLSRKLPNIFFDSKKTGSNEFKFLFRKSQMHSLEGDFDKYFTTYFSEDYTIDNLSIISPEVMQTLIDSKEYDIEIYKDKLYLYNELEPMPKQLFDIEQKGKQIRDKLDNNIKTYRDERINYDQGRSTVSILGLGLRQSIMKYYIGAILGAILVLVSIYLFVALTVKQTVSDGPVWFLFIGLIVMTNNIRKIIRVKTAEKFARVNKHIGV